MNLDSTFYHFLFVIPFLWCVHPRIIYALRRPESVLVPVRDYRCRHQYHEPPLAQRQTYPRELR